MIRLSHIIPPVLNLLPLPYLFSSYAGVTGVLADSDDPKAAVTIFRHRSQHLW